jgi:WD40 repeat protein
MLAFACAFCHKKLSVADDLAGKKVKCPLCGQVTPVPAAVASPVASAPTVAAPGQSPPPPPVKEEVTQPPPSASDVTSSSHSGEPEHAASLTAFLAPPQADDELGRLGGFRILKILGHGGMGVVYRAEDVQLRRPVALKAMLPGLGARAKARERFLREARAAASLKHDHIVTIHQVGEERGAPFLAMEFLEGEPLDQRLKRQGKLELAEALRIGRETALGLAAAHARGLIHRDIKPANLWLEAETGRVKILDFGLARAAGDDAHLTQTGAIVGTPAYMAPEQAQGKPGDGRCDLFSLGCVLYRLSTGHLPFKGTDTISTLMAVASDTPRPPRQLNPEVPAALEGLILKLLAKEPEDRPASARDVAKALQALTGPLPAVPRPKPEATAALAPPTPTARTMRGSPGGRRRRLAAAGVALLALAGLVWYFWPDSTGPAPAEEGGAPQLAGGPQPGQGPGGQAGPAGKQPAGTEKASPMNDPGKPGKVHPGLRPPLGAPLNLGGALATFQGNGHLTCVALSGDGKTLAGGDSDGTIKLWDVASGEEKHTLKWHRQPIFILRLSGDGKVVASVGKDGTVKLWDVASGKEKHTVKEHNGSVTCMVFSGDGKTLASGGYDGTIKLWDVARGEAYDTLKGDARAVTCMAFSGDGKTLASGDRAGKGAATIKLWDLASGEEEHTLKGHGPWVQFVAFSGDGKSLASGTFVREGRFFREGRVFERLRITLWDVASGKEKTTVIGPESAFPESCCVSPDGKTLATSDGNKTIYLWDVAGGHHIHTLIGHTYNFRSMAFSGDGRVLASRDVSGTIKVWDLASVPRLFRGHTGPIDSVVFSGDDKTLLSVARALQQPGEFRRWDVADGHTETWFQVLPFTSVAISGKGKTLALGTGDGTITLLDATSGKVQHTLKGHTAAVLALAFSGDDQTLVSVARPFQRLGEIRRWDVAGGTAKEAFRVRMGAGTFVAFTGDGKTVASVGDDGKVKVWDVASGREKHTLKGQAGGKLGAVAFSPDGKTLATGSGDGTLTLWDVADGKEKHTLKGHTGAISLLRFSGDGKTLASAGADHLIRLWDVAGGQAKATLCGHLGVTAVAFSGDGKALASGGQDGAIKLWDLTSASSTSRTTSGSPT